MLKALFLILIFWSFLFNPSQAFADVSLTEQIPNPAYANSGQSKFKFTSDSEDFTGTRYTFGAWRPDNTSENLNDAVIIHDNITPLNKSALEAIIPITQTPFVQTEGAWTYRLWLGDRFELARARNSIVKQGTFRVFQPAGPGGSGLPAIRVNTTIFKANSDINVHIINAQPNQGYTIWFSNEQRILFSGKPSSSEIIGGERIASALIRDIGPASDSLKTLCMTQGEVFLPSSLALSCDFRVTGINIVAKLPSVLPGPAQSNQIGIPSASAPPFVPGPCQPDKQGKEVCETALGPIQTNPAEFIKSIFGILLSLAGGVAIILIIISGYRLMASSGNPEKVQAAREQLTSAIVGLLFIIFSLTILEVIGVDILHIPGLAR